MPLPRIGEPVVNVIDVDARMKHDGRTLIGIGVPKCRRPTTDRRPLLSAATRGMPFARHADPMGLLMMIKSDTS